VVPSSSFIPELKKGACRSKRSPLVCGKQTWWRVATAISRWRQPGGRSFLGYPAPVEWTPATIRQFRQVGLCLPQDKFATKLGFAERTIGNAERGTHPPSLAPRRALDHALEKATDAQRDRFLAAVAGDNAAAPALRGTNPTLESVELPRRTEASDLGTGTLEQPVRLRL
jgi:transcriptional regulator with XRE-family HTH domain